MEKQHSNICQIIKVTAKSKGKSEKAKKRTKKQLLPDALEIT